MSERIGGSYDDALYKSTYTLLYFTYIMVTNSYGRRQRQIEGEFIRLLHSVVQGGAKKTR